MRLEPQVRRKFLSSQHNEREVVDASPSPTCHRMGTVNWNLVPVVSNVRTFDSDSRPLLHLMMKAATNKERSRPWNRKAPWK